MSKLTLLLLLFLVVIQAGLLIYQQCKLHDYKIYKEIAQKGPDVYIAGMSEKVRELQNYICSSLCKQAWLSRHLSNCLFLIEQQKGLTPLEYEPPDYGFPTFSSNKTYQKFQQMQQPFFKPYSEPNYLTTPQRYENIYPVSCIINSIDMELHNLKFQEDLIKARLEYFAKRLERLNK